MSELVNFQFPKSSSSIIKVIGVGGGGCNAVSHMFEEGITGVDYIICNTDSQAMENSPVPVKIQLGVTLTEGRGAGNMPEMGEQAARENYEDLKKVLQENTKMLFITAGMGGGTGTGAAPVIASLARELDILTIAVVTVPSPNEGKKRFQQAMEGVEKLAEYVDSMLVIRNERLHTIFGDLPASEAFKMADNIVLTAVKGVAEIITIHGNVNIDFADVYTVLSNSSVFIMGTGFATGEGRAVKAVQHALESPLLDSSDISGTKNILLNIISGKEEITIGEIGEIIEILQKKAGQEADIIWGNGYDEKLGDEISVTILATGFETNPNILLQPKHEPERFGLGDRLEESTEAAHDEPEFVIEPEPESAKIFVFEETFSQDKKVKENKTEPSKSGRGLSIFSTKSKTKKKSVKETASEESTNSWFLRNFGLGGFFDDDDDQPIE